MHSDTWCPIPFVGISLHPTGTLTRCMMSEMDMTERNIQSYDWDNENFQKLRADMLAGKWDEDGCANCLMKENAGVKSQRQNWLTEMKRHFPTGSYDNPGLIDNTVRHLFLNFNNVCNFKCRMCSPRYSNSLIPEHKHMMKTSAGPDLKFKEEQIKNINNVIEFLMENKHRLKNITSIWVTGGEPFMGDTLYDVQKILNEYAKPEQITMSITTNGSKVDLNKLQSFENFKMIRLDLSMDMVGKMFEYTRSAGVFTWEQMDKFVDDAVEFRAKNWKWFSLGINSSYQIFNAAYLKDFFEYANTKLGPGQINMRVLVGPQWFQARHAPDSVKKVANERAQELLKAEWLNSNDRNIIGDCLRMLNNTREVEKFNQFKQQTIAQDTYRKVDLRDYDPLLGNEVYSVMDQESLTVHDNYIYTDYAFTQRNLSTIHEHMDLHFQNNIRKRGVSRPTGKRSDVNDTRLFIKQSDNTEVSKVFKAFNTAYAKDYFSNLTGVDCTKSKLRVELAFDRRGLWIDPHRNIPEKAVSMEILITTRDDVQWGSFIYNENNEVIKQLPTLPNTGWLTWRGSNFVHGMEKDIVDGLRKAVIISYVDGDWQDTHQLYDDGITT